MAHNRQQSIIGILGKPAAGKDTLAPMLAEECRERGFTVAFYKFSDMLGRKLDERGLERTTANLQWMGSQLEREEGDGAVARNMREWITSDECPPDIGILNGVRWRGDVALIRELGGFLILVQADAKVRFKRKKARRERPDDATLTWERFCEEDDAPTERFIDELGVDADTIIENNTDGKETLRQEVRRFVAERLH